MWCVIADDVAGLGRIDKINLEGYFYVMEKGTPHYPLSRVKELVSSGNVRSTAAALRCARELGFRPVSMIAEILKLERTEFYKSMTTNHTIWQDVYHHKTDKGMLYIKLTVLDDVLVVSFKEL